MKIGELRTPPNQDLLTRLRLYLWKFVWPPLSLVYNTAVGLWALSHLLLNQCWKTRSHKNFRPLPTHRPLKVGIVSEYYYPHLGGLSGDVHYAAIEFSKKGYDVKLITSNVAPEHNIRHSEFGFEILRLGKSYPVFANGSMAKVTLAWNIGSQVKKMIREQKFDVIHIHCPLFPMLPILVQRYADCPVIGHLHTLLEEKPAHYKLWNPAITRLWNDMEGLVAVSEVCAKQFREWFGCSFKIIPNGVPVEWFQSVQKKLPAFDDQKTNLFFIGRMEPRNGLKTLFEAFEILHERRPQTRLILAGDGPLKDFFKSNVSKELQKEVFWIGPILKEKPAYFATADIHLCPTTPVSSLGVTLLESMASSRPVVCSDILSYNETAKDEVDVLMAPPFDPKRFAQQVERLMDDPELAKRLADKALLKMKEKYDWSKIIDRVDDYSLEVLERLQPRTLPTRPSAKVVNS